MIIITLIDTETNEKVEVKHDIDWHENPDAYEYMFEDGNYACDCIRSKWFNEAKGVTNADKKPCGVSQYRIDEITDEASETVYNGEM